MDKKQHLIDVQPIQSKEQLEDMKWSLKKRELQLLVRPHLPKTGVIV